MRLDVFLARWFYVRSRSSLAQGIRKGQVQDAQGQTLRAAAILRGGERLLLFLPGIAPTTQKPPTPVILYEDDALIAVNKPAGLLAHPSGTDFAWSVVGLLRDARPQDSLDLVHRLDRDTSGVLLLSKTKPAGRQLKAALVAGDVDKHYVALCRGSIPWQERLCEGRIGSAGSEIRIKMGVVAPQDSSGLTACTALRVNDRKPGPHPMTWVGCQIYTGRTHQIRVHLDQEGYSIVGDRLYGVEPAVFLRAWEHGVDDWVIERAGAPRQALHAQQMRFAHPTTGDVLTIAAPVADDMLRWWKDPTRLPFDRPSGQPTKDPKAGQAHEG